MRFLSRSMPHYPPTPGCPNTPLGVVGLPQGLKAASGIRILFPLPAGRRGLPRFPSEYTAHQTMPTILRFVAELEQEKTNFSPATASRIVRLLAELGRREFHVAGA